MELKKVLSYFSNMHGFAVTFSELKVNLMIRETCSSCSRIKYKPNITGTCKLKRLYEELEFCFRKSAIADIVYFEV